MSRCGPAHILRPGAVPAIVMSMLAGAAMIFGIKCGDAAKFWAQKWCRFLRSKLPWILVPSQYIYIYICMSVEAGKFRLGCPVLRINGCPNPFTPIFLIGEIGYVPYKSVEICRKNQLANNKGSVNRSFPRRPNTLGL